jgi:hypothetical protein
MMHIPSNQPSNLTTTANVQKCYPKHLAEILTHVPAACSSERACVFLPIVGTVAKTSASILPESAPCNAIAIVPIFSSDRPFAIFVFVISNEVMRCIDDTKHNATGQLCITDQVVDA